MLKKAYALSFDELNELFIDHLKDTGRLKWLGTNAKVNSTINVYSDRKVVEVVIEVNENE